MIYHMLAQNPISQDRSEADQLIQSIDPEGQRLSYENFRTVYELSTHSHIMLSESMKNLSMLINKWPYLIATCIRCGLQFFYHLMSAFSLKKRKMCYLTLSETIKCHYKSHNNYETLIKFHLKTHQQLYS